MEKERMGTVIAVLSPVTVSAVGRLKPVLLIPCSLVLRDHVKGAEIFVVAHALRGSINRERVQDPLERSQVFYPGRHNRHHRSPRSSTPLVLSNIYRYERYLNIVLQCSPQKNGLEVFQAGLVFVEGQHEVMKKGR